MIYPTSDLILSGLIQRSCIPSSGLLASWSVHGVNLSLAKFIPLYLIVPKVGGHDYPSTAERRTDHYAKGPDEGIERY